MAAPVIASSTSNSGGSTNTLTMTKPSGVTSGDLLIVICGCESGSTNGYLTPPSGWTLINYASAFAESVSAFYRVADGGEGATTDFGQTSTSDSWGLYLRLTGQDTSAPINVVGSDYSGNGGGGAHNIPGVTTDVDDCLAFAVGAAANISGYTFAPSGWTTTNAGSGGATPCSGFSATKTQGSAGATGNANINISPDSWALSGFQFAIAPAEPVVTGTATVTGGEAPDVVAGVAIADIVGGEAPDVSAAGAPTVTGTAAVTGGESPDVVAGDAFAYIVGGEAPDVAAAGAPTVTGTAAITGGEAPDVFATVLSEGEITVGEAPDVAAAGAPTVTGTAAVTGGEAPSVVAKGYRELELAMICDLDVLAPEVYRVFARNLETGAETELGEATAAAPTIEDAALADGQYALRVEVDGRYWRSARYAQEYLLTITDGEIETPLPGVVSLKAQLSDASVLVTWSLEALAGSAAPEDFGVWISETSPVDTSGSPETTAAYAGPAGYLVEIAATSTLLYVAVAARSGSNMGPVSEVAVTGVATALEAPAGVSARKPDGEWSEG